MLVSSIGSFNFPVLTGDTLRHLASVEYFFLTHHSFCHLPKKCFYFGQEHLELAFIIGVSHGSPDKSKHVILICIDCQPLEYLTLVLCFFKLKDVMEDGKIMVIIVDMKFIPPTWLVKKYHPSLLSLK